MPRQLSSATRLETLKKAAKRRLRAMRESDPQATLRDAQLALARDYGFDGWAALKARVAEIEAARDAAPQSAAVQALLSAAERGDAAAVAHVLAEHPAIVNQRGALQDHDGLRTALHFGVRHEAVVRTLLEHGADPNIRDEGDNAFPLHFAAEQGNLPVIRLLVEHGAQTVAGESDDHELDIIGWATAFYYVEPNPDVVEYLLAHGAQHTMFSAVATGAVDAIRALATRAPEAVNKPMDRTNHRRRPLHLAIIKKQLAALATLLQLGADVEGTDGAGLTPLDQAALSGDGAASEQLLAHGAAVGIPAALFLGRQGDLEQRLREDPDALKPGHRWGTLIVRAAGSASAEIIETLIHYGASATSIDDTQTAIDQVSNYTALHAAAWDGNVNVAAVLLKHGADPRIRDSRYCGTPAGWANYNGKAACRDLILQSERIDIFDAISLGRADLIRAIVQRDPEAVQRAFGAYAACERESASLTPLAFATSIDNAAAVRILGSLGAEFASGGHLAKTQPERVAAFLRMACLDWAVGGPDRLRQMHAAERLLTRYPEIAQHHFLTAVVCGNVEEVERALADRPAVANEIGGPRGWPPLLYVCSTRLPSPGPWSDNAVRIARALLDHGADPNAYYEGGNADIHYTALTCTVGRGEEQTPVHPKVRELAALLLERGAEPYDSQFLYNVYGGHASHRYLAEDDFVWLLEMIRQRALALGRERDWQGGEWRMFQMGGYGGGAWYLLSSAMKGNFLHLAEWALAHGASPNPSRASDRRTQPGTLYEQAIRTGRHEFAALLARYGARATDVAPLDDVALLFEAADQDRADLAAQLLDRGVSPNAEEPGSKVRPLHNAAYNGSTTVVQLLIDRGAEIDPRDTNHSATPIYWAFWGRRPQCVDLLTPYSRDTWTLTCAGKLDRLREVVAADPRLARARDEHDTILFYLPDDEKIAFEIAKLLLANGADPTAKRPDGTTAADVARARGLNEVADLLE